MRKVSEVKRQHPSDQISGEAKLIACAETLISDGSTATRQWCINQAVQRGIDEEERRSCAHRKTVKRFYWLRGRKRCDLHPAHIQARVASREASAAPACGAEKLSGNHTHTPTSGFEVFFSLSLSLSVLVIE